MQNRLLFTKRYVTFSVSFERNYDNNNNNPRIITKFVNVIAENQRGFVKDQNHFVVYI